jgi:hypothetical protein
MLKHFKIDTKWDMVPGLACYQMNIGRIVNDAIKQMKIEDEQMKLMPSWAATVANPLRNKSLLVQLAQSIFLGLGNYPELNVDDQAEIYTRDRPRVAMMFFPSNTRNIMLEAIGRILQEALAGYLVVVLCGSMKYNNVRLTNLDVEDAARQIVIQNPDKPILFIAAAMAQRSFSIPEITELYLAYDRGEQGATTQKMSRALTAGDENKIGRIFSLSFDPNRDDKFDAMIVQSAVNEKKRNPEKSLQDCLREVIRVIDIFSCTANGAVRMEKSDYLKSAFARNGISRVLGKIANFELLSREAISALAKGNNNYFRNQKQEAAPMGKIRETTNKKQKSVSEKRDLGFESEIAKAREVITTIIENLKFLVLGTNSRTLEEAMEKISQRDAHKKSVERAFGFSFETIYYLFKNNVINQVSAEMMIISDEMMYENKINH